MLQSIIDRRLSGKNKSIGNRERFLKRYESQVKKAVDSLINKRSLKDASGQEISIPKKDLQEHHFVFGSGGTREQVHPGNKDFYEGDLIEKPQGGGQGSGSGEASEDGESQDDFVFSLSKEEFLKYFFENLELPYFVRKELAEDPEFKLKRAGFTSAGSPSNLHIVRSLKKSLARKMAFKEKAGDSQEDEESLEDDPSEGSPLKKEKRKKIPFLDPIDLKYRDCVKIPQPSLSAVMVCIMDTSGSMDEDRKNLAKRFYMLLYMFLKKNYEKIEVVFIKHTTKATEVDEEDFFYSQDSGGTVVSTGLDLAYDVIKERYPVEKWNIYVAQASDGDNWESDNPKCAKIIADKILPLTQYYAYLQVAAPEQGLWSTYKQLKGSYKHFEIKKATQASDIYPVFKELFEKRSTNA